jgi:hypothetical protein
LTQDFSSGSHSPPFKGRGRGGVSNSFQGEEQTITDSLKGGGSYFSEEKTQTITDSLKGY